MRINQILFSILFVFTTLSTSMDACTTFVLKSDGQLLLAKNLDWLIGDGFLMMNKKGARKKAFALKNYKALEWTSLYGSITFNQFGKDFPLGGMNEKGLVIEELNYSPSRYPSGKFLTLNEFQWIQYHLDNSQSVREVIESLDELAISPVLFRLHYMICDRHGEIAIIEFIDGEVKIYSGADIVVPVLTNNSYENSLKYLQHHKGFGGTRIVSDGPESPERFVRAATMVKNGDNLINRSSTERAFTILHAVRQQDTQWSIVYDLFNRKIQFKILNTPAIRSVNLDVFDFENSEIISFVNPHNPGNAGQAFEKFTIEKNSYLLTTVFGKLIEAGEISETSAAKLIAQLIKYSQKK